MKIIFAGSNNFASYILENIILNGYGELSLVITQPDKKSGRGQVVKYNPVKESAVKNNLKIFQPENINAPENSKILKQINSDLLIIVAYGQILNEEIINCFNKFCINLHLSLLPELRGPTPVETAILNGFKKTGITIQRINKMLDAGDIILQKEIDIDDNMSSGELYERMKIPAIELLNEFFCMLNSNNISFKKQDESKVSKTIKFEKQSAIIDWNNSSINIHNKIRAFNPVPGASTFLFNKLLKIYKSNVILNHFEFDKYMSLRAGTIIIENKKFFVRTKDGFLEFIEIQFEGKRKMTIIDFLNGHHLKTGEKFSNAKIL